MLLSTPATKASHAGNLQRRSTARQRDRAERDPRSGCRWAERQQGLQRGTPALRYQGFIAAGLLQGAAAGIARQPHHRRWRDHSQGPAVSNPGTEPRRCAGAVGRTDSQRSDSRENPAPDAPDPRLEKAQAGGQEQAGCNQGRAWAGGFSDRSASQEPVRCSGSGMAMSSSSSSLAGSWATPSGASGISSITVGLVRSIGVKCPGGSVTRSMTRRGRQNE